VVCVCVVCVWCVCGVCVCVCVCVVCVCAPPLQILSQLTNVHETDMSMLPLVTVKLSFDQ